MKLSNDVVEIKGYSEDYDLMQIMTAINKNARALKTVIDLINSDKSIIEPKDKKAYNLGLEDMKDTILEIINTISGKKLEEWDFDFPEDLNTTIEKYGDMLTAILSNFNAETIVYNVWKSKTPSCPCFIRRPVIINNKKMYCCTECGKLHSEPSGF